MSLQFIHLRENTSTLVAYEKAWDLQKKWVEKISKNEMVSTVFLLEHQSVITRGKGKQKKETLNPHSEEVYVRHSPHPQFHGESIPVVDIDRGGDLTWHGEGQLVVYPILKLDGEVAPYHDVEKVIRLYEQSIIEICADYGLGAFTKKDETGVWINFSLKPEIQNHKKIASIGIGVRKWTTFHGIAFNIDNTLEVFKSFDPCGYKGEVMTSLKECEENGLLSKPLPQHWRLEIPNRLSEIFSKQLNVKPSPLLSRTIDEIDESLKY